MSTPHQRPLTAIDYLGILRGGGSMPRGRISEYRRRGPFQNEGLEKARKECLRIIDERKAVDITVVRPVSASVRRTRTEVISTPVPTPTPILQLGRPTTARRSRQGVASMTIEDLKSALRYHDITEEIKTRIRELIRSPETSVQDKDELLDLMIGRL